MPADSKFIEKIIGLLSPLGEIKSRPMFGGFGIFSEGNMFALISGSTLFFKVDDTNRDVYSQAGSHQYKPMPYFEVPSEVLNNADTLKKWAESSISIASKSKTGKK
jgi:DNA transformation protein